MKKYLLMIFGTLMLSSSLWAKELVPLSVSIEDDDRPIGNGHGRPAVEAPLVYIEDYTLIFEPDHSEYILNIKNENGVVVYSTVVYSVQTLVALPSNLCGFFAIQLDFGGSYYFVGEIEL